jgi:hypothetical protein
MDNLPSDWWERVRAHPDYNRWRDMTHELYWDIDHAHFQDAEHKRRNEAIWTLDGMFMVYVVLLGKMTFDEYLIAINPIVQELRKQGILH